MFGILDSFVKNVFCDVVKPKIGSVVKIDLTLGPDHTGIYIGDDQIVELNGDGEIRIVSPEEFIEGDDAISRCGAFIYVACAQDEDGNCYALGSRDIARRAKQCVGESRDYNVVFENCHMFTEYCINGKRDGAGLLWAVEAALTEKFHLSSSETLMDMWRSTGESRGDNPSFD